MTIGYYPTGHPDELFYSRHARFIDLFHVSTHAGMRMLGASPYAEPSVGFISHLNSFMDELPYGRGLDAEQLMIDNTLLPYYSPFVEPIKVKKLIEQMKRSVGGLINTNAVRGGELFFQNQLHFLRYCPLCVAEERAEDSFGECYWHRNHQIMSVKICLKHKVFLEDSTIPYGIRRFLSAEKIIQHPNPPRLITSSPFCNHLIQLAEQVEFLFSGN